MNDRPSATLLDEISRLNNELVQARALELRARDLLEAAPDAIVVVDRSGRIVLVNSQTEKLFGYSRAELIGEAIEILVPAADRGRHTAQRNAFIAQPSVRPMGSAKDLFGRRRDGSEVPVEISLSPMHAPDGVLISAAIRDISERREAQEALRIARDELELRVRERTEALEAANFALRGEMADRRQAQQALFQAQKMEAVGQLTGGVAHDFNNLLTVVMGNLQILALRLKADPVSGELVHAALRAAKRGADLNRTLLAFSRKQCLAPAPLDLSELVASLAGMLRRTLGERIDIQLRLAPGLAPALADPAQLETALLNLAVNARDAMPDGGTLTLETAAAVFDDLRVERDWGLRPGRYLLLAVSDTGGGMAPDVLARAFEPFFTTKDVGKGSGLGLAMVYGFVKQSNGHVKIYSEVGRGTTVKIFLPMSVDAVGVAPAADPGAVVPTGTETILVVEDEPEVRALACRVLGELGYRILAAADGPSALEVLRASPEVALLFTDVVLPGAMTGPALVASAQAERPGLKVLYASGYTGNVSSTQEPQVEPARLLSKPYAIEDLAARVRLSLDEEHGQEDHG
ncbi:MAG: PAS domain S-box protein [Zoogloeaceae bacterium]|nr:PAS domain S-box protein [Zoogloeaceae bacterium]